MSVSAACAIGAVLLASPSFRDQLRGGQVRLETSFAAARTSASGRAGEPGAAATRVNLFAACPSLLEQLPPDLRPDSRAAGALAASPTGALATVVTVDAPVLRGPSEATVLMTSDCGPLCGHGCRFRFEQVSGRWAMDGKPDLLWVS